MNVRLVRPAAAALTLFLCYSLLVVLTPDAQAQTPGGLSWEDAKRLQRFAPAGGPSLPAGQPPRQVVHDVWDERHSIINVNANGQPRLEGHVQTRAFVAEPVPYLSHYLQFLPEDFRAAYQAQIDGINARLNACADAHGAEFARWINRGYPETKPSWAQLHTIRGLSPVGTTWSDCVHGSPDIIICEDSLATPQLDYDQCVPINAHVRHVPNHQPLERDTWMSDYVSDLMRIPRESDIRAAYGNPFAFESLMNSDRIDNGTRSLPPVDLQAHLAPFLTEAGA